MIIKNVKIFETVEPAFFVENALIIRSVLFPQYKINNEYFFVKNNGFFYYRIFTRLYQSVNNLTLYPETYINSLSIKFKNIQLLNENKSTKLNYYCDYKIPDIFDLSKFEKPNISKVKIDTCLNVLVSEVNSTYTETSGRECYIAIFKSKYNGGDITIETNHSKNNITPEFIFGTIILFYDIRGVIGLKFENMPIVKTINRDFTFDDYYKSSKYTIKYHTNWRHTKLYPVIYNDNIPKYSLSDDFNNDNNKIFNKWITPDVDNHNILNKISEYKTLFNQYKNKEKEIPSKNDEALIVIDSTNKSEDDQNDIEATIQFEALIVLNGIGAIIRNKNIYSESVSTIFSSTNIRCNLQISSDKKTYIISGKKKNFNTSVKFNVNLIKNTNENIFYYIHWFLNRPLNRSIIMLNLDENYIPELSELRYFSLNYRLNNKNTIFIDNFIYNFSKSRATLLYFINICNSKFSLNDISTSKIYEIGDNDSYDYLIKDPLLSVFLECNGIKLIFNKHINDIFNYLEYHILHLSFLIFNSIFNSEFNDRDDNIVLDKNIMYWKNPGMSINSTDLEFNAITNKAIYLGKGFSKNDPLDAYNKVIKNFDPNSYIGHPDLHDSNEIIVHEIGHLLSINAKHTDPKYKYRALGLSSNLIGKLSPTFDNAYLILSDSKNIKRSIIK